MVDTLLGFDRALFLWLNGIHSPIADIFFLAVTQLGNGWVIGPILIGIILFKVPKRNLRRVLLCGVIGLSVCGIVNSQIKKKVGRLRPVAYWELRQQRGEGDGGSTVHQVGTNYHSRSFPSGHTNTAFSAATFLALIFGRWFFLTYIGAFLVGYSRVYLGVHFPLDVASGALWGVGFMVLFIKMVKCDKSALRL